MTNLDFDLPQNQSSSIKVIGVGGGGSNAVNYMYINGIRGVDFVVCNTDQQSLDDSPVPNKIQLGVSITEGLGAGADPLRGKFAAEENIDDVISVLENNTKMVFINAGMGGGTGTGAAPVIAKAAKDLDILTVAIVTIPFEFEGDLRMKQAREGIEELKQHVDSLIVINNNKLREIYGKLGFKSGFAKADEILATASRGIAEVITQTGHLNIDLNDARTVLSNSGTAIMGTGTASGEDRAIRAVKSAIESPLLDNNHIRGAKKVLLLIVSGTEEVTFEEMGIISDFIQDQVTIEGSVPADIIMGVAEDDELGDAVNVTVVATGFHEGQIINPLTGIPEKVKYDLDDMIPVKSVVNEPISNAVQTAHPIEAEVKHILEDDILTNQAIEVDQPIEEVVIPIFSANEAKEDRQQVSMSFEFDIEQSAIESTDTFTEETNEEKFLETTSDSILATSQLSEQNSQAENEVLLDEILISEEVDDSVVFSLDDNLILIDESSGSKDDLEEQSDTEPTSEKIIHTLSLEEDSINFEPSDEMPLEIHMESTQDDSAPELISNIKADSAVSAIPFEVSEDVVKVPDTDDAATEQPIATKEKTIVTLSSHSDTVQEQIERAQKRKDRLQKFNYRFRNNSIIDSAEREPAYKRQGIELNQATHSTDEPLSRTSLTTDQDGLVELKSRNSFLHDNVD